MITRRTALSILAAPLLGCATRTAALQLTPTQKPIPYAGNPVLFPTEDWEGACAMPFSGGIWWDRTDLRFKCWYLADLRRICYAVSDDGLRWEKPHLDVVSGTNIVLPDDLRVGLDSSTVWLDDSDKAARWKLVASRPLAQRLDLYTSRDGIHFESVGSIGPAGDRSTMWFNHVRGKWIYNVRAGAGIASDPRRVDYVESDSFVPTVWNPERWLEADQLDPCDANCGGLAQLYALDVNRWGDGFIGLFNIWRGQVETRPKLNNVTVGFSKDGIVWTRTDRTPFLTYNSEPGSWNYGNVQSVGGCYLTVGTETRFYFSGRSGNGLGGNGVCTMGVAVL